MFTKRYKKSTKYNYNWCKKFPYRLSLNCDKNGVAAIELAFSFLERWKKLGSAIPNISIMHKGETILPSENEKYQRKLLHLLNEKGIKRFPNQEVK